MRNYTARIQSMIILPEGDPIFSEMATRVSIDDKGAGEFIVLSQDSQENGSISICAEEWTFIKQEVDMLFDQIRENTVKFSEP